MQAASNFSKIAAADQYLELIHNFKYSRRSVPLKGKKLKLIIVDILGTLAWGGDRPAAKANQYKRGVLAAGGLT